MSRPITIALAQTGPVLTENPADGVPEACRMVDAAAAAGAQLLCFGELFLTPFFPNRLREDFDHLFLTLPSPVTDPIFERAREHGLAMVFPYGEKTASAYYNSALVVDAAGNHVGTYRKTHIPAYFPTELAGGTGSFEKFYFTPGDDLPVFDVAGARIGIQICNDRLYPEPSRVLARRGAEIIFMPICYSTYGDTDHRIGIWEVPLRSRAYENGVWVAAANRVGTEEPRVHIGRSMLVDPRGTIVREAGMQEPELLVETIDLDAVGRQRKKFPWWRDTRPDLYDEIVHPV
ncbi:MAG: carbon-nitrogen hydrolase family protein [Ectothiorhodospiraceae bacterium]|nr:carbon-nitrogen hydrolase family protein [Chromatiales bacterium]MCP5155508.1 carbon-nitrogen hydrolase family protein [Ectothiorhodospiraceae bacterium]